MMGLVSKWKKKKRQNKRLCRQASEETREVAQMMCDLVEAQMTEFRGLLVHLCKYTGGACHEMKPCGGDNI